MLTAKQYKSINEIEPQLWDCILNTDDVFHKHSFISIVENSKVENADFFYLLIYDNEKLVSTTVFSAFKVSLDLFIGDSAVIKKIKKIFPNIFSIKILACGLPASFGQLNLKITDDKYANEVASVIATEMKALSKKLGISLLTVKEFRQKELQLFNSFKKEGFFTGYSIPYMNLDIKWKSFDEYLTSMRHHHRRRILLSLKKINQAQHVIIASSQYSIINKPALILTEPDLNFAEEFYQKYLAVMQRTPTKLETLNLEFFKNLFKQKEDYKLLNLVVKGEVISSAVLIFHDDVLTFMLVAKENEKDEYDSYFNLVYGIIALGIQYNCKKIKMGQTAYWVKQCVGALPEDEFIYFASRKPLVHSILKSLRNVIFPETKLKPANIFKKQDNNNKPVVEYEQYNHSI